MTELRPLVEASASSATRELLRAGRSDAPGREFSERLLIGLGVGAAATTVSAFASAGTAAAALQGAASTGSGTASLTVLAAKWVAVGVVGGGILAGSAEVAFSPPRVEPVTKAVASAAPKPARAPKPGPLSQPSAALVTPLEAEPTNEAEQPKAVAAPPSAAPLEGGKLGHEVEAIDRARRAMAAGKLQQALRELDAFERIEGTGVLAREAKVLRIEALYRLGEDARARQLAEQYRAAYPNDSHLTRLRAFEQPNR